MSSTLVSNSDILGFVPRIGDVPDRRPVHLLESTAVAFTFMTLTGKPNHSPSLVLDLGLDVVDDIRGLVLSTT